MVARCRFILLLSFLLWLPGPEAWASLCLTTGTEVPIYSPPTTETPPSAGGTVGLRHTPLSCPGLSRPDAQGLIPLMPFCFPGPFWLPGLGREPPRSRYFTAVTAKASYQHCYPGLGASLLHQQLLHPQWKLLYLVDRPCLQWGQGMRGGEVDRGVEGAGGVCHECERGLRW